MLNTTWSRISDEKDMAWKYVMVQVLVKYERVHGPPPPLNLIVIVAECLVYVLTCTIGLCTGRGLRPWRRFAYDERRDNKLYSQIKAESEQHRERRVRLLTLFFSRRELELERNLYSAWNAKEDLSRVIRGASARVGRAGWGQGEEGGTGHALSRTRLARCFGLQGKCGPHKSCNKKLPGFLRCFSPTLAKRRRKEGPRKATSFCRKDCFRCQK